LEENEISVLNDFYRYYLINAQINGLPSVSLSLYHDMTDGEFRISNRRYKSMEYSFSWCFDPNNFTDINSVIENIRFNIKPRDHRFYPEDETPEEMLKKIKKALKDNFASLNYLYKTESSYIFIDNKSSSLVEVNGVLLRAISTSPFSTSKDYSGSPFLYDTYFVIKTCSGRFMIIHAHIDLTKYKQNKHVIVTYWTGETLYDAISRIKNNSYIYDRLLADLDVLKNVVID
jgi:hypothetical protein